MARKDEIGRLELAKYNLLWSMAEYRERSPGMRFLEDALARLQPKPGASFLDIGTGTGAVAAELKGRGFKVTATDIAPNANTEFDGPVLVGPLWDLPDCGPFDFGFCADLMEHIPTDLVRACLDRISDNCKSTYFQIANFDCGFGDEFGFKTHLTVKPMKWWRGVLSDHFASVDIGEFPKHHIAVCLGRAGDEGSRR